MNQKHSPPITGNNQHNLELVTRMNETAQQCATIIHSTLTRCTIEVEAIHNGLHIKKRFHFGDHSERAVIPIAALKLFFHNYMSTVADAAFNLVDTDKSMLQYGTDIVTVQDFLKDYSQGNYPAINAEDYIKVRDLEVNQVAVIKINNSIQSVTRIK